MSRSLSPIPWLWKKQNHERCPNYCPEGVGARKGCPLQMYDSPYVSCTPNSGSSPHTHLQHRQFIQKSNPPAMLGGLPISNSHLLWCGPKGPQLSQAPPPAAPKLRPLYPFHPPPPQLPPAPTCSTHTPFFSMKENLQLPSWVPNYPRAAIAASPQLRVPTPPFLLLAKASPRRKWPLLHRLPRRTRGSPFSPPPLPRSFSVAIFAPGKKRGRERMGRG